MNKISFKSFLYLFTAAAFSAVPVRGDFLHSFENNGDLAEWNLDPGVKTTVDKGFATDGKKSCLLSLDPGAPWFGMTLSNVPADMLKDYRYLEFDLCAKTDMDYFSLMISDGENEFPVWFQTCYDNLKKGEKIHGKIDLNDNDIVQWGKNRVNIRFWGANRSKKVQSIYIDKVELTGHGRAYRPALNVLEVIDNPAFDKAPADWKQRAQDLKKRILQLLEKRPDNAGKIAGEIAGEWEKLLQEINNGKLNIYHAELGSFLPLSEGLAALKNPAAGAKMNFDLAKNEYQSKFVAVKAGPDGAENFSFYLPSHQDFEFEIWRVQEIDISDADQFPGKRIKGTTPDALIPADRPEKLSPGELAYYLFTVKSRKGIAPGTRSLKLQCGAKDIAPVSLDMDIKVRNFELPEKSSLKTYFNTWSHNWENFYRYGKRRPYAWLDHTEFTRIPDDRKIAFAKLANRYRVGLVGMPEAKIHELHVGAVEVPVSPGWRDYVEELGKVNGLAMAAYLGGSTTGEDEKKNEIARKTALKVFKEVRAADVKGVQWLVGLMDEPHRRTTGGGMEGVLKEAAFAKKNFPECRTLLASGPALVPVGGKYDNIDIVATLCDRTELRTAAEQRKKGRETVWYSANVVYGPNLSWSTFYQNKLMTRMMPILCFKYGMNGFLHWSTLLWGEDLCDPANPKRWPDEEPWNSRKSCWQAGEGYMFYPGRDGYMWPSLRIENFRAGMQDYEYLTLLQKSLPRMTAADRAAAEKLLSCSDVASYPYEYTDDPDTVLKWRSKIADLIEKYRRNEK